MPPDTLRSPLVSVLITVYNREKYLAAAIESVLAQTFSDFELIIVDDCSEDRSVGIARRYESDPRIKIHVNEKNLGDYPNRNRVAALARGRFLKYVDADDLIYPHCLEMLVEAMEAFPEAVFGISRFIPGAMCPVQMSSRDAYLDHFFGSGLFSAGPLNAIIRRSAFKAIGGFANERHTGDGLCWLTLARKGPVAIIFPGLAWWRRHEQQESIAETKNYSVIAEVAGRRFKHVLEALDAADCPLAAEEKQFIRAKTIRVYARGILGRLVRGRFQYAKTLLRESGQPPGVFVRTLFSAADSRSPIPNLKPRISVAKPLDSPRKLPPPGQQPAVSVLIPVHNAETHLAEAIGSVFAQRHTDWEIIIADDASTDRTAQIAEQYADDQRIFFHCNDKRLGEWANHNRCADFARGKYLKFLHVEDRLYPHCLEMMVNMLAAEPQSALLVSLEMNRYYCPIWFRAEDACRQEYFGLMPLIERPSFYLYRREEWQTNGGIKSDHPCPGVDAHFRMAARGGIVIGHAGLINCGIPSFQAMHVRSRGDTLPAEVIQYHLAALKNMAPMLDENEIVQARNRWLKFAARQWYLRVKKGEFARAQAIFRMFGNEVMNMQRWKRQKFEANPSFWADYYENCGRRKEANP